MASTQPMADPAAPVVAPAADPAAATDNPTITHSQYPTEASAASSTVPAQDEVASSTAATDSPNQKASKRLSTGFKGMLQKLKPRSKSGGRSPSAETPTESYGEAGASTMAGDHPGGIIPHTARAPVGENPVQVQSVAHNPGGGIIGEVDLLLTKEVEKIMQAMADMVENSAKIEPTGDIPGISDAQRLRDCILTNCMNSGD